MAPDDDPILELACSISDGTDVTRVEGGDDSIAAQLRAIGRIAAFHRELDELSAVRRWGRLELVESLGTGARGEVWRAWDADLKRSVAVKFLRAEKSASPELLTALLEEGRIAASIRHDNVVEIYSVERHEGALGLSMELIEGSTLQQIVRENGPMSAVEATAIGADLCSALAAIHARGVLHRDVKAQNVMRQAGGRIVLMDFSSGIHFDSEPERFGATTSGTPLYMAPELLAGAEASRCSDIYALGVLLFYLTTTRFPVTGKGLDALRTAHRLRKRDLLRDVRPELPAAFVDAVESAIDPAPDRRPATAGEFARRLGVSAPTPAIVNSGRVGARGARFWIGAGAAGLALAIVAGGVASLWRSGDGAFEVEAQLFRTRDGATAEVSPGERFELGDKLSLRYRASAPTWLYIVDEDETGNPLLLYPMRGATARAPLRAGEEHRLPQDTSGRPFTWELNRAGGKERLLLVASRERLVELEADLFALETPQLDGPHEPTRADSVRRRLRGFGALKPADGSPASPAAQSFVADTYQSLVSGPSQARGIWARRVVIEGPAR